MDIASTSRGSSTSMQRQHVIYIEDTSPDTGVRRFPNVDLISGSRKDYIKICVPLYKASKSGDWKAAKVILDQKPELVRFSITENYDTLLHIAASAKSTKLVENYVENLVDLMTKDELELRNKDSNTAFCLAVVAGTVEIAEIMVNKNSDLLNIHGSQGMTPLYMAALFGNHDMVRYLYAYSEGGMSAMGMSEMEMSMMGISATPEKGWVLIKCIESDLFDVALDIVTRYLDLDRMRSVFETVLFVLARKPDAFSEIKPHIFGRIIALFLKGLAEKEVEAMIPPSYRQMKNKDGLTPYESFAKSHKDLVSKGEEWMKGTAAQCMVVAALIATIVFAAAFTVPGGYDQNNGLPMFRKEGIFIVFVISDAISLIFASASILMFLYILTSRYSQHDFLETLPKKLMIGLATLFLSITSMMIAFSVSFFVLYREKLIWVPIIVSILAAIPVFLYAKLQYPLLADVYCATYRSKYLFKPKKRMLFNETFIF